MVAVAVIAVAVVVVVVAGAGAGAAGAVVTVGAATAITLVCIILVLIITFLLFSLLVLSACFFVNVADAGGGQDDVRGMRHGEFVTGSTLQWLNSYATAIEQGLCPVYHIVRYIKSKQKQQNKLT